VARIDFADKFVAFLDILGFKKLVADAENGNGEGLAKAVAVLEEYGSTKKRLEFATYGPTTCPESQHTQRDLSFRSTSVSDCIVVSAEISPAGVINLVGHCWSAVLRLLQDGFMCRGYISRGKIFHTDGQFIGSGYQQAYENESKVAAFKRNADERGTPFVEVDRSVRDYVGTCDSCVQEMFRRFVKDDGEVLALFPFQRLEHSFIIGDAWGQQFDPKKEQQSNNNLRIWLSQMKERVAAFVDNANPSAVSKAEHYIRALDAQLAVCDQTDNFLLSLMHSSFPIRTQR
jgi:hypothetical protein